jgi:tRNA U38,U39,U40 pseudouridine synthase TruA
MKRTAIDEVSVKFLLLAAIFSTRIAFTNSHALPNTCAFSSPPFHIHPATRNVQWCQHLQNGHERTPTPTLTHSNARTFKTQLAVQTGVTENQSDSDSTTTSSTQESKPQHSCQFCPEKFASRNALFRHLRNNEACATKANGGNNISPFVLERNDILLSIAYDVFRSPESALGNYILENGDGDGDGDGDGVVTSKTRTDPSDSDAKIIGDVVKDAFQYALRNLNNYTATTDDKDLEPSILKSTQTSVANLRHHSLSQENGVGSAGGEVMSLSYLYPVRRTLASEKKAFREMEKDRVLTELLEIVDGYLMNRVTVVRVNGECDMDEHTSMISGIDILSAKNLPRDAKIHAEMSCTQRVYHYMLPLRWLEGGKDVETWWINNRDEMLHDTHETNDKDNSTTLFGISGEMRARIPPPNQTLRKLKDALRSAECKRVSKSVRDESIGTDNNIAKGRYGVLGMKPRKAWHNFANPSLQGDASPSNKPVWRVLDRCRILQFVPLDSYDDNGIKDDTQVMVAIQFRGDDFVEQQARRIIGSAVAMANEWLPADFIQSSTRSEVVIETPLAPDNRMYFAESRFHFDELIQEGKKLFDDVDIDTDNDTNATDNPSDAGTFKRTGKSVANSMANIQKKIMDRNSAEPIQKEESSWLSTLKNDVSPRILKQMEKFDVDVDAVGASYVHDTREMPSVYNTSLSLLRDIIAQGRWPSTSAARSRVIRKDDTGDDDENGNQNDTHVIESGSFTVINPKFQEGVLMDNPKMRVPLCNQLFPELVEGIFELEESLSNDPQSGVYQRPPSSHCAVNRNAQFTPHVDSGRGAGQSLSMICGLGDYNGGELMIEGEPHDIRYIAKDFDGWKQRHWTAPFVGERYSLVWFTPEM